MQRPLLKRKSEIDVLTHFSGTNDMCMLAIDRTIQRLCHEIHAYRWYCPNWRSRTEEDLLYEACVCIFGSQMVFEVAEKAARTLKNQKLLRTPAISEKTEIYKEALIAVMSDPLCVTVNGKRRKLRVRFKNRLASLLANTLMNMYTQEQTLSQILAACSQLPCSAQEARKQLIHLVCGFGPKQASLFLRRTGFCSNLAILDVHIIDYLRAKKGMNPSPSTLSRLAGYEKIEAEFQAIAAKFGYPTGCVDWATWVTMRVAKREAVWCS